MSILTKIKTLAALMILCPGLAQATVKDPVQFSLHCDASYMCSPLPESDCHAISAGPLFEITALATDEANRGRYRLRIDGREIDALGLSATGPFMWEDGDSVETLAFEDASHVLVHRVQHGVDSTAVTLFPMTCVVTE